MQAVGLWVRLVKYDKVKVTPIRVLSKCTLRSLEDETKDGTWDYRKRSAPNSHPQFGCCDQEVGVCSSRHIWGRGSGRFPTKSLNLLAPELFLYNFSTSCI